MSNDYFTAPADIALFTPGRPGPINQMADAIEAGFDKLPSPETFDLLQRSPVTAGGTANALTITNTSPVLSYQFGQRITFKASATNTGAVTVNVDGVGAKELILGDGQALDANNIVANRIYDAVYDGTRFQMLAGGSAASYSSAAAASAAEALASENNAATSEGNAATSEYNAHQSELNAAQSASDAYDLVNGVIPVANGGTGVTSLAAGAVPFLQTPNSANLRSLVTDEVGTGALYFVGGALGTPASANLANATGLPVASGISGLASGVADFFADPTSAKLAAALTDETGTGAAVFANAPTFAGKPTLPASVSGGASLNMPHGSAPSSPVNGDIWTTTAGMFARIGGATRSIAMAGMTQLAPDQTNVGAASVEFTSIPQTYSTILLLFRDVGALSPSTLRLSVGDASAYRGPSTIILSMGSSSKKIGGVLIPGYTLNNGICLVGAQDFNGSAGLDASNAQMDIEAWAASGGLTRIKLEASAGDFTSSSTFSLWGF